MEKIHKLVIIGSGPAGLTAGIYAARAQLEPIILQGDKPGGQLMGTSFVENWPGTTSILGPDLMLAMQSQATSAGCLLVNTTAKAVTITAQGFKIITTTQVFLTQSIIIATGASPKRLNCPGEERYWGKGVTSCAVCDGVLYKDQPVIIIGGGDSGMEAVSFLGRFTKKITVIQNLDHLTASQAMQKKAYALQPTFIFNAQVTEIIGDQTHATGVKIIQSPSFQESIIEAAGIFLAIGLHPNSDPFKGLIKINSTGYIQTEAETHTSIRGIFAAGDVTDPRYRQAITSAGSGCKAALDAEEYLRGIKTI